MRDVLLDDAPAEIDLRDPPPAVPVEVRRTRSRSWRHSEWVVTAAVVVIAAIATAAGVAFAADVEQAAPWVIGAAGTAATLLLGGLVLSLGQSRRRAVAIADEITTDLRAQAGELSRLAAIVVGSSDAILRIDPDLSISSWNRGATEIYGWEEDEAIGRPVTLLSPPGEEDEARALMAAVLDGERIRQRETTRVRKDGTLVHAAVSLGPITGADGEVLGISSVSRDISEQKVTEVALARLNAELEGKAADLARSNEKLEQFAYIASHDLQEPLRAVASFVDRLGSRYADSLDERGQRYVRYAVDGAKRMQALIDALLEYSQVGRGGAERSSTDMTALVGQVEATLRSVLDQSGGRVVAQQLPVIDTDPLLAQTLLQNLFTNALKFRADGRPPRIEVTATRLPDAWQFAVADNGIGIEPRYRARVFEVFKRLHSVEEYPGTGIGLAICKRIVDAHGGRIWVEDSPLGGSQFSFTIPDARSSNG